MAQLSARPILPASIYTTPIPVASGFNIENKGCSMTTRIYDEDSFETVTLSGKNDEYVITLHGRISVSDGWGFVDPLAPKANNHIVVNGILEGGVSGGGVWAQGENFEMDIGKGGVVSGNVVGIEMASVNGDLDNAGYIFTKFGHAVAFYGTGATVHNSGLIQGVGGIYASGDGITIVNDVGGLIKADWAGTDGITIDSGAGFDTRTVNNGLIIVAIGGGGYDGGEANDTFINTGRVSGGVDMQGGDDVLDNRGGIISGSLTGGAGDDLFITDKNEYFYGDSEIDTVKSSASYTLISTTERLFLIGKANINGTGAEDNNQIWGNAGNNFLKGLLGDDRLDGRGGNDRLVGGDGHDHFIFATGYDRDTIKDFEKDIDSIDVSGWKAITSFGDLKNHHAENHGGDVWIVAGDDTLIIEGLLVGDLKGAYFGF
jgi:Ca2+-binding RTX toxin-like protein